MDYTKQVDAVSRVLTDSMRGGRPARATRMSRRFDAPPAEVWDAITSSEKLPRWFLPISGDLRVDGRYQLAGNASGRILACDQPRLLSLTWEFGGEISWVDVRIVEDGAGARLELGHTAHVNPEWWDQYGPGAAGVGWDMALLGLQLFLAGDTSITPDKAEAWATSPEGVAFIRASSEAWCGASVAAGTPEASARAAAGRTTAFYTGAPAAE